jgi:hypothetical protein
VIVIRSKIFCAAGVSVTENTLTVDLSDGRSISVPLGWYPRLEYASAEELQYWRLIGQGERIHWKDLHEDISVEGLLAGKPSEKGRSPLRSCFPAGMKTP